MSEHVTDLREMQAKVNEICARMAELQQHLGYTWIGNPESGEWRLRCAPGWPSYSGTTTTRGSATHG